MLLDLHANCASVLKNQSFSSRLSELSTDPKYKDKFQKIFFLLLNYRVIKLASRAGAVSSSKPSSSRECGACRAAVKNEEMFLENHASGK
ncbi:MAG: hypothetical protein K0S27_218 [Gammaproteobacteria bacterium]|nr:hypothetical protein [Gammaproteobacteria bacterium]